DSPGGNCDDRAGPSTINDCRPGTGANNLQTNTNSEILPVGRGCDFDGIARSHKRDGMADSSTGSGRRHAVVAVIAVYSIDIPSGRIWGSNDCSSYRFTQPSQSQEKTN